MSSLAIVGLGAENGSDLSAKSVVLLREADKVLLKEGSSHALLLHRLGVGFECVPSSQALKKIAEGLQNSPSASVCYCVAPEPGAEEEKLLLQLKEEAACGFSARSETALRSGAFESLESAFAQLRGSNGCPWDKAQTHESLKPYLIEECYEALDAIDARRQSELKEELGDVLLQIMLHCQIAKEEGAFDAFAVCRSLEEKIVRRHPHVFANKAAVDLEKEWEEAKAVERSYASEAEKLSSVAKSLPAAMYAQKLQQRASRAGVGPAGAKDAAERLIEEAAALIESLSAGDKANMDSANGALLFSAVNVCMLAGCDAESILKASCNEFIYRFSVMEQLLIKDGKNFGNLSFHESEYYWELSKNNI